MGRGARQAKEDEPQIRQLELTEPIFQELLDLARKVYFFEGMAIDELDWVCKRIGFFEFPDGTPIIRQGGPGDSFFLVYKGRALVRVNRGFLRRTLDVATLVRGHVFGEMALVLEQPRSADVIAKGDVQVFVVKRKVFEHVMRDNTHFADAVREIVRRRTGENDFVMAYT